MDAARSTLDFTCAGRRRSLVDSDGALCATCCAHALAVAMLSNNAATMLSVDARAASKATIATATMMAMIMMSDAAG
eukprot:1747317-Pleurochrysis_carterae.AAC.1